MAGEWQDRALLIWLDSSGRVKQYLTRGNYPNVGETDFSIFAYFDGLDMDEFDSATIKFKKPDRQGSTYPLLVMMKSSLTFASRQSDGGNVMFTPGETYSGFRFYFANFTDGDEFISLLDTPGLWEATITVIASHGRANVSGLITFSVGQSASDQEEETVLSIDEVVKNIIMSINSVKTDNNIYVRSYDDLLKDARDGMLPKDYFTEDSIAFDNATRNFYKLTEVRDHDDDQNHVSANPQKILSPVKVMAADQSTTLGSVRDFDPTGIVFVSYGDKVYAASVKDSENSSVAFEIKDMTRDARHHGTLSPSDTFATAVSGLYFVTVAYYTPSINPQTGVISWTRSNNEIPEITTDVDLTGPTGVGIESVFVDNNNRLVITYDDGSTQTTNAINIGVRTIGNCVGDITLEGPLSITSTSATTATISLATESAVNNSTNPIQSQAVQSGLNQKVDKVTGKDLSTNDFTNEYKADVIDNKRDRHTHANKSILDDISAAYTVSEKEKLSGIAAGAQANVLEGVKVNGSSLPITNKEVNIDLSSFITNTVDNLVNYYTKSETYTRDQVDGLIAGVNQFRYQVAAELPEASESTMFIVYLTPNTTGSEDIYVEWITVDNGANANPRYVWEKIGSTQVDLSAYSTTAEMNSAISAALTPYYTAAQVDSALGNKVDKVTGKGLSTNDFTDAEKAKLAGIAEGAQVNTVTSVAGKTGAVTLSKGDVGLGNVDNTSDVDKPVSNATQTALNAKQDTLASGTNIKTINGSSILGSGNIETGTVKVHVVSTLPTQMENDSFYLADSNVVSAGGVVEFPVPTASDAGKVFSINSSGQVVITEVPGLGDINLVLDAINGEVI